MGQQEFGMVSVDIFVKNINSPSIFSSYKIKCDRLLHSTTTRWPVFVQSAGELMHHMDVGKLLGIMSLWKSFHHEMPCPAESFATVSN